MNGEDLAIIVPVLDRPHHVQPLLDSIERSTPGAYVLFVADEGDDAELNAIHDASSSVDHEAITLGGTWPGKINRGIRLTTEPYIFAGADDLRFQEGWYEAARAKRKGCVGVNDLLARREQHATHFLMTRAYALKPAIDGEPGPISTAYQHQWCDNELIATATLRGEYAYAKLACVEHLHPMRGKSETDDTYRKGNATFDADRVTFEDRRKLWGGVGP